MPLDESEIGPFAGNGREDIVDGPLVPKGREALEHALVVAREHFEELRQLGVPVFQQEFPARGVCQDDVVFDLGLDVLGMGLGGGEAVGHGAARKAARLQVRAGRAALVDGPFAEAKEMVGGYFLLEVAARDDAVAIAADCPAAQWATVEVREFGPCFT